MSAALTLASLEDLDRLDGLIAAYYEEDSKKLPAERRRAGLEPFLKNEPYAAAYLIGPVRAPVGYVLLSFGWSLEIAGHYCKIEQIFVRKGVRGRGIATEVLMKLSSMLKSKGMKTFYLHANQEDQKVKQLCKRTQFISDSSFILMRRDV